MSDRSKWSPERPATRGGALTRRGFLRSGIGAGAAALLPWRRAGAGLIGNPSYGAPVFVGDFSASDEWARYTVEGIATREVDGAQGLLIATSDVYPSDGRAIAFPRDLRLRDAKIRATLHATGREAGLVLRRVGRRRYYAALYQQESGLLSIVARSPDAEQILAQATLPSPPLGSFDFEFSAQTIDLGPPVDSELCAQITPAGGAPVSLTILDGTPELQEPGDAGLLSTADGNIPPEFATAPPGVGDFRAFYGSAQGEQFIASPPGQALKQLHRTLGTGIFEAVELLPAEDALGVAEAPGPTIPSSSSATTIPLDEDLTYRPPLHRWLGARDPGAGQRLGVVSDVPARIRVEYACSDLELDDAGANALLDTSAEVSDPQLTGAYTSAFFDLVHLERNKWLYWRPLLQRHDESSAQLLGPEVLDPDQRVQGARTLPGGGDGTACFAIASCATQFGAPDGPPGTLAQIEQDAPHVFHWSGDLHYPDSQGLNSQNVEGYSGIWREYLATPELRTLIDRFAFAPVRDDHDYGGNDVARDKILNELQHGVEPFEEILGARFGTLPGSSDPRLYYRFAAPRMVEVIVLEQRRYKDTPESVADVPFSPGVLPAKSLIGSDQRDWLVERLRDPEPPFKVICSPCPLNFPVNNENHWGTEGADGFTGERDWILDQIDQITTNENPGVRERIVWVTGDSHSGMVVRRENPFFLELRPTPLNIAGEGGAPLALPDPATLPATNDEILFAQNGNFYVRVKSWVDPGATPAEDEVVMSVEMIQETGLHAYGPEEFRFPSVAASLPEPSTGGGVAAGAAAIAALEAWRRLSRRENEEDA